MVNMTKCYCDLHACQPCTIEADEIAQIVTEWINADYADTSEPAISRYITDDELAVLMAVEFAAA